MSESGDGYSLQWESWDGAIKAVGGEDEKAAGIREGIMKQMR